MRFIAHRGLWSNPTQRNTRKAFSSAFTNGLGAEIDVRDFNGELVISHDIPSNEATPLSFVLEDYVSTESIGTLAFNIKSDGLHEHLSDLLHKFKIENYFCFDMSVPDTLSYLRAGITTAARLSEYEPEGLLARAAQSLWVDSFHNQQTCLFRLDDWLTHYNHVCFVSPELHGGTPHLLWKQLSTLSPELLNSDRLFLCTDQPLAAQEMFI